MDDEGLMNILTNYAGTILSNSIHHDKVSMNKYKLIRLIEIGMTLFESMSLEMVMIRAENKLKDLMSADRCVLYLVD